MKLKLGQIVGFQMVPSRLEGVFPGWEQEEYFEWYIELCRDDARGILVETRKMGITVKVLPPHDEIVERELDSSLIRMDIKECYTVTSKGIGGI